MISNYLLGAIGIISFMALNNRSLFDSLKFDVAALKRGELWRIITCGFVHADFNHLLFNLLSFYFFASSLESSVGTAGLLFIFFGSLAFSSTFSFIGHRHQDYYTAVGASGAVSGVIFGAIAVFPGMELMLILLPIPMPAWVFGLGFIAYSIYGMRTNRDNIGHDAHLYGALVGMALALILVPSMIYENERTLLFIIVPTSLMTILLWVKPTLINSKSVSAPRRNIDDEYNHKRAEEKEKLNQLLQKVKSEGAESLSEDEKEFLRNY